MVALTLLLACTSEQPISEKPDIPEVPPFEDDPEPEDSGLVADTGDLEFSMTGPWSGSCDQTSTYTTYTYSWQIDMDLVESGDGSLQGSGTLDYSFGYGGSSTYGYSYDLSVAGARLGPNVEMVFTTTYYTSYTETIGFTGSVDKAADVLTGTLMSSYADCELLRR